MKSPFGVIGAVPVAWGLALCALSLSCAGGDAGWSREVRWKEYDAASLPDASRFPDDGGVILLDEGRTEVFGGEQVGFAVYERHRIARIFDMRAEGLANVVIPYSSSSQVQEIQARTIGPDGRITVLDPAKVYDVSLYPGFIFFADQRAKIFSLPAVEPGSTIEYRYGIRVQDRTLWNSWTFQAGVPTLISRFTLVRPGEWSVQYRAYNIQVEPTATRVPDGFKSTMVWEARDIPPFRSEVAMPPLRETVQHLAVAPVGFATWNDVASWYHRLSDPRTEAGPEVRRIAGELTSGVTDDRERLRRIYLWVRDRVRYLAVEVGIGGFRPEPAEAVCSDRYGDCKGMVTLLCALAREAGITAYQALTCTRQNGRVDSTLVSPLQFNHVIACAELPGGDVIWMDPTEKGCGFGELPWYDQGVIVFVVRSGRLGELVVTPRAVSGANLESFFCTASLDTSGSAEVDVRWVLQGAFTPELRERIAAAEPYERQTWARQLAAGEFPGAVLDTALFSGVKPEEGPLVVRYRCTAPEFAQRRGGTLAIAPGRIHVAELSGLFRAPARTHPVMMRFENRRDVSVVVRIPPGFRLLGEPGADTLSCAFGRTQRSWAVRGDTLEYRSLFKEGGTDVPVSEYPAFREFHDGLRRLDGRELVLTPR